MKTQINTQPIIKAIFIVLFIALVSPTANAQRRSEKSSKKNQQLEQQINRPSRRTSSQKQNIDKFQEKKKSEFAYHSNKYKNKKQHKNRPADYRKYSKKQNRNNWDKQRYNGKKQHNDHYGVLVRVHPPNNRHWNIHHRPHISFRHLPRKAIWVYLDGESFYVHKGRFYQSSPFGYFRVRAPRYISTLPDGCNVMMVNGYKVFNYRGLLFIDTPLGYKVISS